VSAETAAAGAATQRVFFALWPSPALAQDLAGVADECAGRFGGRPTRPETIHLTLAFLGAVPVSRLAELAGVARAVAAPPFVLELDRLAFWPHQKLLWAGCRATPPALAQLVGGLHGALAAAGFAVAAYPDFVPHVSLLRRIPHGVPDALPVLAKADWACDSFVLAASHRSAAGADYRVLAEFPMLGTSSSEVQG